MTPQREGKFRVLLRVPALAVTASLVAASTLRGVAAAAPYALLSCRRHVELWAPVWGWLASPSQSRHDPWRFLPCVWICVIAMAIMRARSVGRPTACEALGCRRRSIFQRRRRPCAAEPLAQPSSRRGKLARGLVASRGQGPTIPAWGLEGRGSFWVEGRQAGATLCLNSECLRWRLLAGGGGDTKRLPPLTVTQRCSITAAILRRSS